MVRRSLLVALLLASVAGAIAQADVTWKVADEGPRAPDVWLILGDDSRTLAFVGTNVLEFGAFQTHAFTIADAFEFDGANWRPVALNTADAVKAPFSLFFAGGRFMATSVNDNQLFFYVLRGDNWKQIASLPWTSYPSLWPGPTSSGAQRQPLVSTSGWIYVPAPTFDGQCSARSCPTGGVDPVRLLSVSLVDGSVREEPPLPACYGELLTISGQLYLIQRPAQCVVLSSKANSRKANVDAPLPYFRLDGDQWTSLPPWDLPTYSLLSTPNRLWIVITTGALGRVVRFLTASGLSDAIPLPRENYASNPIALELAGQPLVVTDDPKGNIYGLQNGTFVRLAPQAPVTARYYPGGPRVFAAGSRLFATADGWNVYLRGPSDWIETWGTQETPGADAYFMGSATTFAARGTRVFRKDAGGWARLSPAPHSEIATVVAVWKDRPVVASIDDLRRSALFVHDPASDSWEDLHVPSGFGLGPVLASGEDLLAGGPPRALARFHGGAWSVITASPPPGLYDSGPSRIREANGSVYVIGFPLYRLAGDRLMQVFTDLHPSIAVDDIAAIGDQLLLLVRDGSRSDELQAVILSPVTGGYRTLVTQEDISWTGVGLEHLYPELSLAIVGDTLLFGGLSLQGGQLRAQRGAVLPKLVDPAGRFGSGDTYAPFPWQPRGPLLLPAARVRKNLAAVVDTTGFGGVRYRSELTVANFSAAVPAIARVFAGGGKAPVLEIPIAPGVQTAVEDPIPGFVGPVAIEFDGLTDEQDAWAGVRVWSPSDGGTAGTSIVASNPGDLPLKTVIVPPVSTPGSRMHVALAASGDGPGRDVTVVDYSEWPAFMWPAPVIANGGFLQVDLRPEYLGVPIVLPSWWRAQDDVLGYLVRNEAGTNDGTIVPFEPPDALLGRRTRFLPAVVSTSSSHGRYRTELSLGWRTSSLYPPPKLDFSATFRDDHGSWTFPFSIGSAQLLSIEDVGSWLAGNGVPLNPSDFVGTLTFNSDRPEGAADLLVTAVVLARGPGTSGDYGVSVPVINEVQWAENEAIVPGLREDAAFRSNIAVANPEPDGGPSVTLSVSLRRASDGAPLGALSPVTLRPGQRFQFNRALRDVSASGDAYAVVSRVDGTGRFVAYGVMNDNVTGDGTLFPMTRAE